MKSFWVLAAVIIGLASPLCWGETFLVPGEVSTIQSAIIAASDGDTIILAPNTTYTGIANQDISFLGKAITIRSIDPNDPNVVMGTIIDAGGSAEDEHQGFIFLQGEDANSVLDGVRIINGYADLGGGIFCSNSSPTIRNCIISNNTSTGNGGAGIYLEMSGAQILNCTINGNVALEGDGGGISCIDSHWILLEGCQIYDNFAQGQSLGGGIYCKDSTIEVRSSRIYANRSIFGGGVSCFDNSVLELDHSQILGNSANGGGGIYNQNSTLIINHSVFSGNRAFDGYGGGLRCHSQGSVTLTNSIFWGNKAALPGDGTGHEIILTPTGNEDIELVVSYSNIQGGLEAIVRETDGGDVLLDWQKGNLDFSPLFVAEGAIDDSNTPADLDDDVWNDGDYHLAAASLSIDRGDPNSDFYNEPYPNGGRANLGAFGNTLEATLSRNAITLTKGSVKADGKRLAYPVYDTIKLKGLLYASLEEAAISDLLDANSITVRIDVVDEDNLPELNILWDTFAIEYDPNKVIKGQKFTYKRPKLNSGAIRKFSVDYKRNTFYLDASKIDLTGLRFPFRLEIAFGSYLGDAVFHNIEEFATRKELPLRLLLGVSDELKIRRVKVRHSETKGDSLSAKGYITMAQAELFPPEGELEAVAEYLDLTDPNIMGENITFRWGGEDIGVLGAELFEERSLGRFRYPIRRTAAIGVIRKIDLDFNKCKFSLSVKEASPLASTGPVALEIFSDSGVFDAVGIIHFEP